MDKIVRLGAVARIDPDPSDELAAWRADLEVGRIDEPEEIRRRLDAVERGDQIIVRLDLFAEVLTRDEKLTRLDGTKVSGAWFESGAEDANFAHAREVVASHLDDFYAELTGDHGLDLPPNALAEMPLAIEVDAELEQRMARA